jgi:RND family efflux transporter MFP subunit
MLSRATAALAAVLLLAGCGSRTTSAQDQRIPVTVAVAREQSFSSAVELSGTLTAVQSVTVGAASGGRLVSVDVRVGDAVAAGQVLAQVDASQYAAQLTGARAGAAAASDSQRAAQAQLEQARSRLQLAQTTAARMSALYAQGAISKQQQDETQSSLAAARAGVEQAQASLSAAAGLTEQAQAGVAAAGVPLANATVSAPFSGIVTQKFVEPGAVVGPGSPIVTVQDVRDLELDTALAEDDAAALLPGMPLRVRVDALHGASVPARVRAVVPSENPALRSVAVRIAVAPRAGLLPGMFARVFVPGVPHAGVGVPNVALVTRAGQAGVFAVSDDVASFVPVQPGTNSNGMVEVQGLRAGTRIATSGIARLTDGASVTTSER